MRPITDPNYVYRPWPEDRRERARQAALQRLGTPPGFHLIFGVPVAEAIWKDVRDAANKFHYLKQGSDGRRHYEPLWKTRAVVMLLVELLSQGYRLG
jgi:hypothetical protein